jgi:hypothetical protein
MALELDRHHSVPGLADVAPFRIWQDLYNMSNFQ